MPLRAKHAAHPRRPEIGTRSTIVGHFQTMSMPVGRAAPHTDQ